MTVNQHWHHPEINTIKRGQRFRPFKGDRYALIRWSFLYGPMIEESNPDLGKLLAEAPDHLYDQGGRLSVCEIHKWVEDTKGGREVIPIELNTLYEIDWYADPDDEEDEC
jgi:hypothetical protein